MTVAPRLGMLTGSSVKFDAVDVPGGEQRVASLQNENESSNFLMRPTGTLKRLRPVVLEFSD